MVDEEVPPSAVGELAALEKEGHGVRGDVRRIARRGESHEDVARRVLDLGPQQSRVTPALEDGGDGFQLRAGAPVVHRQPVRPRGGDRHRRERVVVARHAAGLLDERGVASLQDGNDPFQRGSRRCGRFRRYRGGWEPASGFGSSLVTAILEDVRRGSNEAVQQLMGLVYVELRAIAGRYMRSERRQHTLQATALVHAYARLFGSNRIDWKTRAHFFAAAATEMRRILVDYARARNARKGPGKHVRVCLEELSHLGTGPDQELVALDEALHHLARLEHRASRVVELRFFAGLDERETAEALGVSVSTVERDWQFAKAWLFKELSGP